MCVAPPAKGIEHSGKRSAEYVKYIRTIVQNMKDQGFDTMISCFILMMKTFRMCYAAGLQGRPDPKVMFTPTHAKSHP